MTVWNPASLLLAAAALGLLLRAVQMALALWLLGRPRSALPLRPGTRVSVLKPLCGLDDQLEANLESFAAQQGVEWELLLGLPTLDDAAMPLARAFAARHPGRVRVVLQRPSRGLNPKVAQLETLLAAATGDVVVVSDANVRVPPRYLAGIASALADERVGLVTHPIAGRSGRALGSRLDDLHTSCNVLVGVLAAKAGAGQDIVVGKSMGFRRSDLAALGDFALERDLLAEDFVLGRRVVEELGKRIALEPTLLLHITERASASRFLARFQRWAVMQRATVGLGLHVLQLFNLPGALGLFAALLGQPLGLVILLLHAAMQAALFARLHGEATPAHTGLLTPLAELGGLLCWMRGLGRPTLDWRGHALRVLPGSRLVPIEPRRHVRDATAS